MLAHTYWRRDERNNNDELSQNFSITHCLAVSDDDIGIYDWGTVDDFLSAIYVI